MTRRMPIVIAFAALAAAQEPRALSEQDLVTLQRAGLSELELATALDRRGTPSLDGAALERLAAAGLPAGVLQRLREHSRRSGALPLSLEDVLLLVESGVAEERLLELIDKSGSRFELTIDQQVEAVTRGLPAAVLRRMRAGPPEPTAPAAAADALSLEDIASLTEAGVAPAEIVRRIRAADARFEADIDRLIELSRRKVDPEVLKEIYARSGTAAASPAGDQAVAASGDAASDPSATGAAGETPVKPASGPEARVPVARLTTHREPSGGFSINIPAGYFVHRESRGPNALISFTDRTLPDDGGLPDAELQVFRYRSQDPSRLTEPNLELIAQNFLNRLKGSYAEKGMTLTYGEGARAFLSGRPGIAYRVASSDKSGTTHEGELHVTWSDDQIFVVSTAALSQKDDALKAMLASCLRSFTLESDRELPPPKEKPEDTLVALFETWRTAVQRRDFALYRRLHLPGLDTTEARRDFVALSDRLGDPALNVALANVALQESGAQVDCNLIAPDAIDRLTLAFAKDKDGFLLKR